MAFVVQLSSLQREMSSTMIGLNRGRLPLATSAAVGKSLVWTSDRVGATFGGLTLRHTGFELAESLCCVGCGTAARG